MTAAPRCVRDAIPRGSIILAPCRGAAGADRIAGATLKAGPPVRLGSGEVMQRECRRVYYSGRVQGVGFRFTAHRVSGGFDVAGSVRNLPDGRVELIAEGEPAELDAFLQAVRDSMSHYIRDVAIEPCPPSSPPQGGFFVQID